MAANSNNQSVWKLLPTFLAVIVAFAMIAASVQAAMPTPVARMPDDYKNKLGSTLAKTGQDQQGAGMTAESNTGPSSSRIEPKRQPPAQTGQEQAVAASSSSAKSSPKSAVRPEEASAKPDSGAGVARTNLSEPKTTPKAVKEKVTEKSRSFIARLLSIFRFK